MIYVEIYKIKTPFTSAVILRYKSFTDKGEEFLKDFSRHNNGDDVVMTSVGLGGDLIALASGEVSYEAARIALAVFIKDVLGYPSGEYCISYCGKSMIISITGGTLFLSLKPDKCKQMFKNKTETPSGVIDFYDGIVNGNLYRISFCTSVNDFDVAGVGAMLLRFVKDAEPPVCFGAISRDERGYNLRVRSRDGLSHGVIDPSLLSVIAKALSYSGDVWQEVEIITESGSFKMVASSDGPILRFSEQSCIRILV